MLVREAVLGDEAGIARVHVASWRETYGDLFDERFFGEEMLERRLCFWRDYLQLSPRPGRMAVAVDAGHIVGFANAGDSVGQDAEHGNPVARPLTLFSIYLMEVGHGTGVGQQLLDAIIGHEPAQLWVLGANHRAIAFYQRNGFKFDGAESTDAAKPALVERRMVR